MARGIQDAGFSNLWLVATRNPVSIKLWVTQVCITHFLQHIDDKMATCAADFEEEENDDFDISLLLFLALPPVIVLTLRYFDSRQFLKSTFTSFPSPSSIR